MKNRLIGLYIVCACCLMAKADDLNSGISNLPKYGPKHYLWVIHVWAPWSMAEWLTNRYS